MGRACGPARYSERSRRCEGRNRSGTRTSMGLPSSSPAEYPKKASVRSLTATINPFGPTATAASGMRDRKVVNIAVPCIGSKRGGTVSAASDVGDIPVANLTHLLLGPLRPAFQAIRPCLGQPGLGQAFLHG